MAAAGAEAPVELEVTGTGLGGLPDQHHAAASEKGFEFNVMIAGQSVCGFPTILLPLQATSTSPSPAILTMGLAGETGLGKSTFLNAMFAADVHTIKPYGEGAGCLRAHTAVPAVQHALPLNPVF